MAINRILLFSGLSELLPKRGKVNGETPPRPVPHADVHAQLPALSLCHIQPLFVCRAAEQMM